MTLSMNRLKEISDPNYWAQAAKPVIKVMHKKLQKSVINFHQFHGKCTEMNLQHLDPRHLRLRAQIIGQEISAPSGKKMGYMENKELTELDRQLITTSRALKSASKNAVEAMAKGPGFAAR